MKGYTQGPWHVMEDGFEKSGRGYPSVYATDDELRYIAKCADFCNINSTDNLANACLISAATDLLEACKKALTCELNSDVRELIIQAIEKARVK
jgi:hypothetical protein